MSKPPPIRVIAGVLLALGAALFALFALRRPGATLPAPVTHAASHAAPAPPARVDGKLARYARDWRAVVQWVQSQPGPEATRQRLLELRLQWLEEDPFLLAQVVDFLLRNADDAATGLPFEVGPGGVLSSWPTLRTFLLELLACADPDHAIITAREILHTTPSADEYALALKPLARPGPCRAPAAELAEAFSRMLAHKDWQNSSGFAEAMDLVRVSHSAATVAVLGSWLNAGGDARLAGMALHETAAEDPASVVLPVAEDPDLLADSPVLRAELMARATISDPAEATAIQSYLENPAISQEEKTHFLSLFPLRSATTGYRLYGATPAPFQQAAVAADDAAALKIVQSWLQTPGFESLQPPLQALEGRLATWVRQAQK